MVVCLSSVSRSARVQWERSKCNVLHTRITANTCSIYEFQNYVAAGPSTTWG